MFNISNSVDLKKRNLPLNVPELAEQAGAKQSLACKVT
jgi:hypothetical protein